MNFDKRCRIERKSVTIDPHYGTENVTWVLQAVRWCNVADSAPGADESVSNRMSQSSVKTTVTLASGANVDTSMRVILMRPKRTVFQILGTPDGVQLYCESVNGM